MIRFIHTADFHFGVENYGKIDPKTGIHTRLLDFQASLARCVQDAISQQVDFFLFCGDAYKTAAPSPTQQKLLLKLFLKLHAAEIPVVIVVGNHDMPMSFGKAHALDLFGDLPLDGFHIIARPSITKLMTRNGPVNIVGIPWPTRHALLTNAAHRLKDNEEVSSYISAQVGTIISDLAATLEVNIPAVLAGHMAVSTGVYSGSERKAVFGTDPTLLPSQLAIKPFDYVALGHLHRHQNLGDSGTIPIVYSGSIEAIDFGEINDTKGYCLVSIDRQQQHPCSYQFIRLPTRPMIKIDQTINTDRNQTEQLVEALERVDLTNALVKISYRLPTGDTDRVDLSRLQKAAAKAFCITSITPIHTPPERQRRTPLSGATSTKERLERYLEMKGLDRKKIDALLAKAIQVEELLQHPADDTTDGEQSLV